MTPATESSVVVSRLNKSFRRADGALVRPVADASLEIMRGEMLVLLGPSGCGKTTLLRCIAGLEQPDDGEIIIRGRPVFSSARRIDVPPERRRVGMIFQSYALWPHMTVAQNVAYPLKARGIRGAALRDRVTRILEVVEVAHLRASRPGQLSGGQQQRVALARALVSGDELVLFDEPLSNVDAKVREAVREDIAHMQKSIHFSGIYVTHDQTEALELADRIAVVDQGRILQVGTPDEVYHQPANRYVATFVGSANDISGTVESCSGAEVLLGCGFGAMLGKARDNVQHGQAVAAIIRPEHFRLSRQASGAANEWAGVVAMRLFSGPQCIYLVRAGDLELRVRASDMESLGVGDPVFLAAPPERVQVFAANAP